LAWVLVTDNGGEPPNLAVAKKLAERANTASQGKDPAILDTLARVLFMGGQRSEAVEAEQKALDAAPDQEKDHYRTCLADYRQGKLPEAKE
jgi:tetratricopeptide (TPR) repeat protein